VAEAAAGALAPVGAARPSLVAALREAWAWAWESKAASAALVALALLALAVVLQPFGVAPHPAPPEPVG